MLFVPWRVGGRQSLPLTFLALVVLVQFEAFERGGARDELVAEFGFVVGIVIATIILVHLLMGALSVV